MTTIPQTMRAWVRRRGGPVTAALELVNDLPTPQAPDADSQIDTDVLIRVTHVALQANSDLLLRVVSALPLCVLRAVTGDRGAYVPELELSGEVVAAGGGVRAELKPTPSKAKIPVFAFQRVPVSLLLGRGTLAEYVRLPAAQVTALDVDGSEAIDMAMAAGLPCAGATATAMLRIVGVASGGRVLINGASGSVGSLAVQLAKHRGLHVVAVASGGNEALVRGLGADEFVDYTAVDLAAFLTRTYADRPFDAILDCAGVASLYVHSPDYLAADSTFINVGGLAPPEGWLGRRLGPIPAIVLTAIQFRCQPVWLGGVPRRFVMPSVMPNRDDDDVLARLVAEGRLRLPVDAVFPMEDALAAYARVATRHARGKVVIRVAE